MDREDAQFWMAATYLAELHYLTLRNAGHSPEDAVAKVIPRVLRHIEGAYYSAQTFPVAELRSALLKKN